MPLSLESCARSTSPVAKVGLEGELRDPVCGMRLMPAQAITLKDEGFLYHFCSKACESLFREDPQRFLRPTKQAP
jgi:P-type Cu+ transporter